MYSRYIQKQEDSTPKSQWEHTSIQFPQIVNKDEDILRFAMTYGKHIEVNNY